MKIANGINKYMNLIFGFFKKIPKKIFIIIFYALCSIASGCILYLINRIPEKIILNLSLNDNAKVDSLIVKCGFYFSIDTDGWSLHTKRGNVDVANFYIAFKDSMKAFELYHIKGIQWYYPPGILKSHILRKTVCLYQKIFLQYIMDPLLQSHI